MTYSNWIRVTRRTAHLGVAAMAALVFMACDGPTATNESSLSVRMTDGDGAAVANVWVDVTELRVVGQSGDGGGEITLLDDATDDDPSNDDASDLVLLSPDNVETLVNQAVLPSGTYGQIRMVIGGAVVETESGGVYTRNGAEHPEGMGTTGSLTCPSCDQTGIKIVPPNGALRLESESKVLMLDFDVYQSFEAGASGGWVMNPVILASELELSGNIAGQISLAEGVEFPADCDGPRSLEDFAPQAESVDDATLKTGTVASDGSYEIRFVQAGEWNMTYDDQVDLDGASLVFEATPDSASLTVEEGRTTTTDYTVTSIGCQ